MYTLTIQELPGKYAYSEPHQWCFNPVDYGTARYCEEESNVPLPHAVHWNIAAARSCVMSGSPFAASIGTLVAHCQVGRYGLQYCYHNGLEGTRECSYNNLAGVICGTDPSQPLNQVR